MQVKYWTNFNKRKNSTKQPSGGTEISVSLKNPCSVENPQIEVVGVPDSANYFYIADFGRYYFRSDAIKVTKDITQFSLEVDTMATYKANVGACSALVEFTSSSSEIRITDPRNKPLHTFTESVTNILDLASYGFNTTGSFIIGIAGGDGGVTYYVISAGDLSAFYDELYDPTFISQIENQYYGLRDCFVSCRWVPYSPAGTYKQLKISGKYLSTHAYEITSRLANINDASYDIAFPSDAMGLGTNYLDNEPYTTGVLYLPYVGVVPLDLGVVAKSKQIRIKISIDNYTGDIVYKLSNTSGDFISSYQGNCSVNIPISSQHYNAMATASGAISIIGGIASTAAAIASKNPALAVGAGIGTAGGAVGIAQSLSIHTQVNGNLSSAVSTELGLKIVASVITRTPTESNLTAYKATSGMPYFKVATISSLSGYVQCAGASVDMPGTVAEKDTVNGYVNGGFYYE